MKSNDMSQMDIILQVEQAERDMYFLKGDLKYKKLYLWGRDEQEYHIKNDPISETLSPWIELLVINQKPEGKTLLDLSFKWYGLKPADENAVRDMIHQVRLALNAGTGLSVNLNRLLDFSDWIPLLE